MRKIILSMMISLDGYIEDENKQIQWHVWNEEMDQFMIGFFERIDTLMFGRKTYQGMAEYWPTSLSEQENTGIADKMNQIPKIVFSKTLDSVSWGSWTNIRLVSENIRHKLLEMKKDPGKDIVIFGGASLSKSFMDMDLIDEYQLIINPIILGKGTPLFEGLTKRGLSLMETKIFGCGNVLLYYRSGTSQGD